VPTSRIAAPHAPRGRSPGGGRHRRWRSAGMSGAAAARRACVARAHPTSERRPDRRRVAHRQPKRRQAAQSTGSRVGDHEARRARTATRPGPACDAGPGRGRCVMPLRAGRCGSARRRVAAAGGPAVDRPARLRGARTAAPCRRRPRLNARPPPPPGAGPRRARGTSR
jgi:hypothetical protein